MAFLAVAACGLCFRLAFLALPPLSDVRYYDVQAAQALLRGMDPYGHAYTGIPPWLATPGAADVFAYFPLVAVFLAPFEAAGSALAGLAAADLLTGWAIFSLRGRWAALCSAVYLLLPVTVIFSTVFPNDTLVAIAFVSLSVAAERAGRKAVAAGLLGLSVASSQFSLLLLPLFYYWYLKEGRGRDVVLSVAVAAAAVLPFVVWDPSAFYANAVLFEFSRAPRPLVSVAAFGTNLNPTLSGLADTLTGQAVPLALRAAATLLALVFFVRRVKDLPSLALNCAFFSTAAVLLLPSVFFWLYLELPLVLLLLWRALGATRPTNP